MTGHKENKITIPVIMGCIKNGIIAILQGKLLLRLKVDKHFAQIAFAFGMMLLLILINLVVDNQLSKMEDNKKILAELELIHTQKSYDLIMLERRSNVSSLLKQKNSAVGEPQKPAILIK